MRPTRALLACGAFALLATLLSCRSAELSAPVCSISPDTLDFGGVALGETVTRKLTITNLDVDTLAGQLVAPCSGYKVSGTGQYRLYRGQSLTLAVTFSPTVAGPADCALSTGLSNCPAVIARASGLDSPTCEISPDTVDFGTVPTNTDSYRQIRIANRGSSVLTTSLGGSCMHFSVSNGYVSLPPGQFSTVTIHYRSDVAETTSCALRTGLTSCPLVVLRAISAGPPAAGCAVTPASLDFGAVAVGDTASRYLVLANTGTGNIRGTLITYCGGYSVGPAPGNTYDPFSLGPGQSMQFRIWFRPEAVGPQDCSIDLGDCGYVHARGTGLSSFKLRRR